jgi:hypothetical protein
MMNYKALQTTKLIAPLPQTLYGVNQVGYGSSGTPNQDATAAAQILTMGGNTMRIAWQWSALQSTSNPSSIFWSGPDGIVAKYAGTGIQLVFCIFSSPNWATGGSGSAFIPIAGSANDTAWQGYYAAYCGEFATRYAGQGIIYEIWDEPNANYSGSFWQPNGSSTTAPSSTQYLSLYSAARTAIKAADPTALVSVGGIADLTYFSGSSTVTGVTWGTQLMQAGIVTDMMSIHPYCLNAGGQNPAVNYSPTGNSFGDIGAFQTAMVTNGYGHTALRLGEWGYWSAATVGSEAIKAGYVTAALNMVNTQFSVKARGFGQAGVTHCQYFALNNPTNGTSDTGDTGLWTGTPAAGPNTILASGTAFQTFITSL